MRFACRVMFPIVAAGALLATATAQAEPLRVRYAVWVGFGPLFVAAEKGFFEREGVDVELIEIDDHVAAFAAFYAGQVDALVATLDEAVAFNEPDEESPRCLLMLDESRGGDGVLAVNDIHSLSDLKGRSVAYHPNGVSEFYIGVLLRDAGLSLTDIDHVDLPPDMAAEAFMLQEVDAAVTWEPYLSRGSAVGHGHLLTDTSQQPGLLADCLLTMPSTFERREDDFLALARAWDSAVHYVADHPDDAHEIIARHMGDWLEDPTVVAEMLKGLAFYDRDRNRAYFGTSDEPGQIYDAVQSAIDVLSDLGRLKGDLEPADVIIHDVSIE